jgi:hypothetical protein
MVCLRAVSPLLSEIPGGKKNWYERLFLTVHIKMEQCALGVHQYNVYTMLRQHGY